LPGDGYAAVSAPFLEEHKADDGDIVIPLKRVKAFRASGSRIDNGFAFCRQAKDNHIQKASHYGPKDNREWNYDGQEHNNSFFLLNVVKN
jgi:hypothetical protein